MAATNFVILPSSPPRQFGSYNMSSSPVLPSPSQMFKKKPAVLRTGSQAIPIPQNASVSLTSVSAPLKNITTEIATDTIRSFKLDVRNDLELDVGGSTRPAKAKARNSAAKKVEGEPKPAKTCRKAAPKDNGANGSIEVKKVRKPRAKKSKEAIGKDDIVKEAVPKKSRAKKADKDTARDEVAKEKPGRKPRAKKAEEESQTKLSKGKITKASAIAKAEKAKRSSKTEKVDKIPDLLENSHDFGLVEAVRRRTAWTPPLPTANFTPASDDILDTAVSPGGSVASDAKSKGFKVLVSNFGYTNGDANIPENEAPKGAGVRKRKLIELVKSNILEAAVIPARVKAPKKKARTITDQATSAYAEEENLPAHPAPLLQYFSYGTTGRVTSGGFKVPPKPRSKNTVKGAYKKGSAQAPILLSPESAMRQVGNQDFVFGTSSQLAREESPTLLRDLHKAMQASNEVDESTLFADLVDDCPAFGRSKAVPSKQGILWSASSRGVGGELLDVELIDLVDSPAVAKPLKSTAIEGGSSLIVNQEDEWPDVDELRTFELTQKSETPQKSPKVGPIEAAIRSELLSSPSNNKTLNSSSPKPLCRALRAELTSKVTAPVVHSSKANEPQMPKYTSYTTIQLAKEIASYHFKPVKNREQMITLLQRCWEGKHRTALGNLDTNLATKPPSKASKPNPSQVETASPKRPRGRPRKDSTTTSPIAKAKAKPGSPKKTDRVDYLELDSDASLLEARTPNKSQNGSKQLVDEISDSDALSTPSPPRRRASQIGTPPLPLQLKSDDMPARLELSSIETQTLLFKHIKSAVTNAPPSRDPKNPSWHEKILLYDPIILEDFAVWLNTGALEKVGWDGEVAPWEVKKWCESNSICCLWKENLRGGARSRY